MSAHMGMTNLSFDVSDLRSQLNANPSLWNEVPLRTAGPSNPHREVDDIWVRYNPLENFTGDWRVFNGPHVSQWYPCIDLIPAARMLSLELLASLGGGDLGGILITRIPPGCQVYPHIDGGWHASHYEKFIIQVDSAPGQTFCFEDGTLGASPGDCYWFDNSHLHWVVNPTAQARVSLIVCIRRTLCH